MSKAGRRKAPLRSPRRLPGGYVSLERRIWAEDMRGDMPLMIIWATLIAWANIVDGKERIGGQMIFLRRGQLVTGLDELADEFGLGVKTVRRCLNYLQKTRRIDRQSGNHGSLITVMKYNEYQKARGERASERAGEGQARGKQGASEGQARGNIGTREPGEPGNTGNQERIATDLTDDEAPPHPADAEIFPAAEVPTKKRRERKRVQAPRDPAKSASTLEAFRTAYFAMHRAELPPSSNAMLNSQACRLVDLVGADVAPALAEYYVLNERDAWIVKARHPFGELLKNWQKYYTNWQTGTKVTGSMAKAVERNDANHNALERLLAREQAQATAAGGQYKT